MGKTFGTNYFKFRGRYFRDKNAYMPKTRHFPDWVAKDGADEEIKSLISHVSVTAKKESCLDLPPLVYTEVDVELSSEQKKLYNSMKKEFIAFCGEKAAVANLAITKALRLQQILSGFLKLEDGSIHKCKENPRADTLTELIEDISPNEKIIVWSIFHHDYELIENILKKLDINYATVTGLTKDKQAEIDRFETDPKCRVMVASQSAGGTGINLIQASTMIYYSKNYSLEHDLQSEARNFRGGSEIHKKITRIDLVARGTVDEIVLKALRDKKDLASNIIALKELLQAE
jgi:SNF2 family DNA or RNA helicase